VRRQDALDVRAEVAVFDGIDDVAEVVSHVEQAMTEASEAGESLTRLRSLRERFGGCQRDVARYEGFSPRCVPEEIGLREARRVSAALDIVRGIRPRLVAARAAVAGRRGIRDVVVPDVPSEDISALRSLHDVRAQVAGARARVATARRASAVVAGSDLVTCEDTLARLQKAANKGARLVALRDRWGAGRQEVSRLRLLLEQKKKALVDAETEVAESLGGLGTCPVCRSPVAGSHPH
jgi:hypothetical protein